MPLVSPPVAPAFTLSGSSLRITRNIFLIARSSNDSPFRDWGNMRTIWFAWALFASAITQVPQLHWIDFTPPQYPQMALIAAIQGEARIEVAFKDDGTIADVKEVSGHPILLFAAKENLRQAKLVCENCVAGSSFVVVYDFVRLINVPGMDPCDHAAAPLPNPVVNSPTHITIYGTPGCIEPRCCPPPQRVRSLRCLYLWKCKKYRVAVM